MTLLGYALAPNGENRWKLELGDGRGVLAFSKHVNHKWTAYWEDGDLEGCCLHGNGDTATQAESALRLALVTHAALMMQLSIGGMS